MDRPASIATLTLNPALDKTLDVEAVIAERKLRGTNPRLDPGGGGVNVARAIAKLGGTASAIYCAGGPTGEMLSAGLDAEGIAQHRVPITGWTRENLTVNETSTCLQYRIGAPGPALTADEFDTVLAVVEEASTDILVLSGSLPEGLPPDAYAKVAKRAAPAKVVLDTSGAALKAALGSGLFLIKPNLRELASLVGCDIETEDHLARAACGLVSQGASEIVLVSLGAAGALLAAEQGATRILAPTVKPASKIGAGDSMVAGFALSLARGWSIEDAGRYAVAAGAAAVMTPGTELCTRADADRLYAGMSREVRSDPIKSALDADA